MLKYIVPARTFLYYYYILLFCLEIVTKPISKNFSQFYETIRFFHRECKNNIEYQDNNSHIFTIIYIYVFVKMPIKDFFNCVFTFNHLKKCFCMFEDCSAANIS